MVVTVHTRGVDILVVLALNEQSLGRKFVSRCLAKITRLDMNLHE